MSRAIWHIAAVAPSLRSRFADDFHAAERVLLDTLRSSPDLVATYWSVLDAWDGGFLLFHCLPEWFPEAAELWESLDRVGVVVFEGEWLLASDFAARAAKVKKGLGRNPGDAYATAILDAIAYTAEMSVATGCPCVILWKSIGAVIDDSEFRSR